MTPEDITHWCKTIDQCCLVSSTTRDPGQTLNQDGYSYGCRLPYRATCTVCGLAQWHHIDLGRLYYPDGCQCAETPTTLDETATTGDLLRAFGSVCLKLVPDITHLDTQSAVQALVDYYTAIYPKSKNFYASPSRQIVGYALNLAAIQVDSRLNGPMPEVGRLIVHTVSPDYIILGIIHSITKRSTYVLALPIQEPNYLAAHKDKPLLLKPINALPCNIYLRTHLLSPVEDEYVSESSNYVARRYAQTLLSREVYIYGMALLRGGQLC